jgi:eukaryotic-like serine/threonine-protein kinase
MLESGEIEERVSRWESLNARGEAVSLEELCEGRPELVDEVGRRIRALESIDRLMESANISYSTTSSSKDQPAERAKEQELPHRLGRYRLDAILGRGGFGQVWRAYDPQLARSVAIKIPCSDRMASPLLRDAFLKEARKVAQLRHPNIVPVYDFGQDGPYYFIVWDLIDGGSLADRIRQTKFNLQEAITIVAEVAEALNYAHLRDIVHRDIKPGNILLDKSGKAYVTDFGVAVTEEELLEEHGAVSGTLAYMSPEQARGDSLKINARTDIYSLGVVLYELLTGRLPFREKDFESLRKHIISGEPRTPRTIDDKIPLELEGICLKAMSKQLADRFSTAGDMANALRHFLRPASPAVSGLKSPGGPVPVEALAKQLGMPVGELIWKTREILHLEIRTPTFILTTTQVSRLLENLQSKDIGGSADERAVKGIRRPPLNLSLGDGLLLNLVYIPEGAFTMGSPPDEEGHNDDETVHEVRITRPFYMGQYPVTQEQFKRVMRFNPSYFDGPKLPVETVSWFECVSFCEALSQTLGRSFRLPTEAEWEYSCRAGTTTPFSTGMNISTDQANFDGKFTYGGALAGVSRRQTTPVGSFPPNSWDLHDMHGNVWEWCSDWYSIYPAGTVVDPQGPPKGEIRVFRGGSWFHGSADCRSAQRDALDAGRRHSPYGFRVVMACD